MFYEISSRLPDVWLKVLPFEILKLVHQHLGNEDELWTIPEVESFCTRAFSYR